MSDIPNKIHIAEVGPRDGLQIESKLLTVDEKVALIDHLLEAGVGAIEVGSFVNPKAVPQMADSEAVIQRLRRRDSVRYHGLWLNLKGFERARATGKLDLQAIIALTASETFARRNTNRGIEEILTEIPRWLDAYRSAGLTQTSIIVMAAFGCNFQGTISEESVLALVERAVVILREHDMMPRRISLADTMGWAVPSRIKRLVGRVRDRYPDLEVSLHLHDTRGSAVANAVAGIEMGVTHFDASVGGIGGCPFAGLQGAAGNICTEDLVFTCEEMGIETGISLRNMVETARFAERLLERPLPGKVMRAGKFSLMKTS